MDVDVALTKVPVNMLALIDDGDFKTIEDAVAYNQSGLALFWNFTTTAGVTTVTAVTPTTAGDYDWTDFTTSGKYAIEMPASGGASANNSVEGFGHFTGVATGILPWRGPTIGFRAAAINDALIDSNTLLTSEDIGQLQENVIATATTDSDFLMTDAIQHDNLWVGQIVTVKDVTIGGIWVTWVTSITSSTKRVQIEPDPTGTGLTIPFTVAIGDICRFESRMHPMYALNTYAPSTRTQNVADRDIITAKQLAYTRLMTRSDAGPTTDDATELTAINADDGAGGGDFAAADSLGATQDDITTVDTVVDAVKVKTDQLTFGASNAVNSNITNVAGGSSITSSGTGDQNYGE